MLNNLSPLRNIKHPYIKEGIVVQPQPYREFHFHDDVVIMVIIQHGMRKEVLFDREDYERIANHTWSINSYRQEQGYVYSQTAGYLHRYVMNMKKGDGLVVDHINRNHLDCRKSNLRPCTNSENCRNKDYTNTKNESGYAGVKRLGDKWRAGITINGSHIHIGTYDTLEQAIEARQRAEVEFYGEFAPQSSKEVVASE